MGEKGDIEGESGKNTEISIIYHVTMIEILH